MGIPLNVFRTSEESVTHLRSGHDLINTHIVMYAGHLAQGQKLHRTQAHCYYAETKIAREHSWAR